MSLFPFRLRKKPKPLNEKRVNEVIQESLSPYMTEKDLQKYMRTIERDKQKKKIWDGLSTRNQIRLLRYVQAQKDKKNK